MSVTIRIVVAIIIVVLVVVWIRRVLHRRSKNLYREEEVPVECNQILCDNDIKNRKQWKFWTLGNHPDRKKGKDDKAKERIKNHFQEVNECRQEMEEQAERQGIDEWELDCATSL